MNSIFNNPDFYPTPEEVIFEMLQGYSIENKIILEPSAGKGNLIDYLNQNGAKEVLFCEINEDLAHISSQKGRFLKADFLTLESSDISHIDMIVMNPPFSNGDKHILHAYNIAPSGCRIIALCNAQTIQNDYSSTRKELKTIISNFGSFENLGNCFEEAERQTSVEVGLINLLKPGAKYSAEFEGFFLDEEEEPQENGIMSYNIVRDLVNRYVESIKIFDRQLEEAERMNQLTSGYFSVKIGMNITDKDKPIQRAEFKKEMQKSGWHFIFAKMNMQKYTTKGLREDINQFVEEKTQIPFTMKNIYQMLKTVVETTEQRMDKAILEVFDKVTQHYHENRFNVEGWKTNSNYLLNQKFIFPDIVKADYRGNVDDCTWSSGRVETIDDLQKAICFITGDKYEHCIDFRLFLKYQYKIKIDGHYLNGYDNVFYDYQKACIRRDNLQKNHLNVEIDDIKVNWGEWADWGYFRIKCFKKGTVHFEFKDRELWARFNQRVAKLKGYPLYESAPDKRTERQKEKAKKEPRPTAYSPKVKPTVLGSYKVDLFT